MKMKMFRTLGVLLTLLFTIPTSAINPANFQYYLYDCYKNADFDYKKIKNMDFLPGGKKSSLNILKPKKGKYTVYRYMSYGYGPLFCNCVDSINIMLIVKVNKDSVIEDAYLYNLEGHEAPASFYLFRCAKQPKMSDTLTISSFGFKHIPSKQYDEDSYFGFLRDEISIGEAVLKKKEFTEKEMARYYEMQNRIETESFGSSSVELEEGEDVRNKT